MTATTYDEAAQSYLAQFKALSESPAQPEAAVRGAGDIAGETLVESAEAIAEVSGQMIPLADEYFSAVDPAVREGISFQFLAQATAEMQLATELMQVTEEETGRAKPSTRAGRKARGGQLRGSIDQLEQVMVLPLTAGIPTKPPRRRAAGAKTVDSAKVELEKRVSTSATAISKQVQELGGDIAFNLVMQSEWSAVVQGAGLLSKDIAELLEKVRESAGLLLQRAVKAAGKTLLNVYDKILALLGKEIESEARQKIREWLGQIAEEKEIKLFNAFVSKLYRIDDLKVEVHGYLQETAAGLDKLNDTTKDVTATSDKFVVFCSRAKMLESALVLAKLIKEPQILTIIAGLQVALLVVVVYAGNDYVGYRSPRFPNLTEGIAEIVRKNICPEKSETNPV